MAHIGIDPGKTGAISVITDLGEFVHKMPKTESDIADLVFSLKSQKKSFAVIEKVHAMPGQGVTSCFSFGRIYGFLRACLYNNHVPFAEITPQKWMKHVGLSYKKGMTTTQKKQTGLGLAQQRYPKAYGLTKETADSLLIATYCKENFND